MFWPLPAIINVSLSISEGIQAFTLLVIFQLYRDKMFKK